MTTNPQNLEPRVDRLEIDMGEVKQAIAETARNVSDLRSTVSTLADLVTIQQEEAERDRQQVSDLRSTVSTLADLVTIQQEEAERDRQQAAADRALMLELIQSIAQGRNGGES